MKETLSSIFHNNAALLGGLEVRGDQLIRGAPALDQALRSTRLAMFPSFDPSNSVRYTCKYLTASILGTGSHREIKQLGQVHRILLTNFKVSQKTFQKPTINLERLFFHLPNSDDSEVS